MIIHTGKHNIIAEQVTHFSDHRQVEQFNGTPDEPTAGGMTCQRLRYGIRVFLVGGGHVDLFDADSMVFLAQMTALHGAGE